MEDGVKRGLVERGYPVVAVLLSHLGTGPCAVGLAACTVPYVEVGGCGRLHVDGGLAARLRCRIVTAAYRGCAPFGTVAGHGRTAYCQAGLHGTGILVAVAVEDDIRVLQACGKSVLPPALAAVHGDVGIVGHGCTRPFAVVAVVNIGIAVYAAPALSVLEIDCNVRWSRIGSRSRRRSYRTGLVRSGNVKAGSTEELVVVALSNLLHARRSTVVGGSTKLNIYVTVGSTGTDNVTAIAFLLFNDRTLVVNTSRTASKNHCLDAGLIYIVVLNPYTRSARHGKDNGVGSRPVLCQA